MCPEYFARMPYNPASGEIFTAGVILFILMVCNPPFNRAQPNDSYFRLILANREDLFWRAFERNKPEISLSNDFKTLFLSMINPNPALRASLADVISSAWYN
jgi:hypothetical protein